MTSATDSATHVKEHISQQRLTKWGPARKDADMLSPADPSPPKPVAHTSTSRSPVCRLAGLILAGLARLLSGSSVRWIASQPDTCQRVYFANHTSHLDALVIWASLPPSIREIARPVAAKDYWSRGFVRRWLASDVFDALLIDRTDIKVHQSPVDLMIREIGTTRSLIVFPEGGRSVTGEVGEFKSGLYYLAKKRPDIELIPVHIDNLNRVLPRGEFLPVPLLSCITFGPPLWLELGEQKADFLARARRAVLALKE
ncbi:MAG: lysophospholipid acyltransferase family protein [Pirellulales bacterium]